MNLLLLAFFGAAMANNVRDTIPDVSKDLTGEALRDYINNAQSLFRAEVPKNSNRHRLMSIKHTLVSENPVYKPDTPVSDDLPINFDARTQWPYCNSIKAIRDQSLCGACWAFGAAEAMSDRVCIATKGAKQPTISAQDLLSCCGSLCGDGCDGGYPIAAWTYMLMYGVCTGGNYRENVGCKPYSIEPCGDYTVSGTHYQHNCIGIPDAETPKCVEKCSNPEYPVKYADDKYYGRSAYYLKKSVDRIKQEIFDNGPVEAAFTVYEDFDYYTGGIYQHIAGYALGGHAVKLIGWGVENDTPYWIAANSWNDSWGENGFFRIISGKNECGIEGSVVAGLPLL